MRQGLPGRKILVALLLAGGAPLAVLLLLAGSPASAPGYPKGAPPIYDTVNTDGQAGSGGEAVVYQAGGRQVTDPAVTAEAPDALLFGTGFGGWEPTLGLDRQGTIFYNARNNNVSPGVVRSRDDGVTWEAVSAPEHQEVSLDPYTWVDRSTGRVFTSDIEPTITCSPLSHTDDGGESWEGSEVCGETDHQNVFGGPPPAGSEPTEGYPNVVYFCAISGGTLADSSTATACSKSLDGGDSFTPTGDFAYPPRVAPQPGNGLPFCDGATGHGIVDSQGTIYLPRAWCSQPHVAISDDQGATWKQVQVSDKLTPFSTDEASGVHEAGIAADQAGNLYFTWVADDHHPYLAISRDGGETWAEPLDLLPPGVHRVSAFTASVDVGAPSKLALVLMGTRDQSDSPEEDTEDTTWDGYIVTSQDALDADPTFYANSVNDPETNPLWIGTCGEVRCGNIGDFLDVVIGPEGGTYAALIDSCPGEENDCTAFGVTEPRGEAILGRLAGGPPLVDLEATCHGQLATIAGGPGVDELVGSAGDDVILAAGGADVIRAGEGDDIVCGRGGDDVIKGGAGDDLLVGNTARDRLSGGEGADRLRGNADLDRLAGGAGADQVRGGTDADRLGGGKGSDRIQGLGGDDRLGGGNGRDRIQGLGGDDSLFGGPGRDTLRGGSGTDRCADDGRDRLRSCERG